MEGLPDSVRPSRFAVIQELGGGGKLAVNTETASHFTLDRVAARMWDALVANHSVESAIDDLTEVYDTDRATLANDINDLIHMLADYGLVEVN